MERTLYDQERHGIRIVVSTERNETGELVIAGHDLGERLREIFGRNEYEYWFTFNGERERLLASRLRERLVESGHRPDPGIDVEKLLGYAFSSGLFAHPNDLTSFLADEAIEHHFFSYP